MEEEAAVVAALAEYLKRSVHSSLQRDAIVVAVVGFERVVVGQVAAIRVAEA